MMRPPMMRPLRGDATASSPAGRAAAAGRADPARPPRLSPAEARVVQLARGLFAGELTPQVRYLLAEPQSVPPRFSAAAVAQLRWTLASAATLWLLRHGGWRSAHHLRGRSVTGGLLWERTPPDQLGLHFSAASVALLRGLLQRRLGTLPALSGPARAPAPRSSSAFGRERDGRAPHAEWQSGDQLLAAAALQTVGTPRWRSELVRLVPLARNALCRLMYPEQFRGAQPPIDFAPWLRQDGFVLECLQPTLARRWADLQRRALTLENVRAATEWGSWQRAVLEPLLEQLAAAGRWDLARFLLVALDQLLAAYPHREDWRSRIGLQTLTWSERREVERNLHCLFACGHTFSQWEQAARRRGFVDEGYEAAQLWLRDWERFRIDDHLRRWRAWTQPPTASAAEQMPCDSPQDS